MHPSMDLPLGRRHLPPIIHHPPLIPPQTQKMMARRLLPHYFKSIGNVSFIRRGASENRHFSPAVSIHTPTRPDVNDNFRSFSNISLHPHRANSASRRRPKASFTKHVPDPNVVNVQKCTSTQDAIQLASRLDGLSLRDMESIWRHLLNLSKKQRGQAASISTNQIRQLEPLFKRTQEAIENCHHSDLSFLAYTLAQFVKLNHKEWNSLLLDTHFWISLQQRSISEMNNLAPKSIVNIAWSFATIHSQPILKSSINFAPFFEAIQPNIFNRIKKHLTSNNLSTLSWSSMTCRVDHPPIYDGIAQEFLQRRQRELESNRPEEELDAVALCQLANAFAKAGYRNKALFQCISDCVIPILPQFDMRNFSNLAHSFATARMNPTCADGSSTLFDEIENECVRKLQMTSPQHMANLLWAYATLNYEPEYLFDEVVKEARGRLGEFAPRHLCNVAWACSKFPQNEDIFDDIAREVERRGLDSFTAQGLAMLANSFASKGHDRAEFWDSIEKAAIDKSWQFQGIECARIAWSFATVRRPADQLFQIVEGVSMEKIQSFNTQGLSNLAWAFSVMGYQSKEIFSAIADRCVQKMYQFKPEEITMLMLAYSRLNHSYPELFDRVIAQSLPQLKKFLLLDLYNMAIAYAKVGHVNEEWMVALADEVLLRCSHEHHRMHTGMLWAYATTHITHPKLMEFLNNSLLSNLNNISGEHKASTAWSLATLGCNNKQLFDALAETSNQEEINKCNTQSLVNMAWAFATAKEMKPELFKIIAKSAMERTDFSPQGISNLLWSLSTAAHFDEDLLLHMAIQAKNSLDGFNSQALSNIAWAYAVANIDAACLFHDGGFLNKCVDKIDQFDVEGLAQLHQWNIWQKHLNSINVLPESVSERCHNALAYRSDQHKSRLQIDVVAELTAMSLSPEEEVKLPSGYSLDAMIDINGNKIGVEVDGPSHYIGQQPNGGTILKHRQISSIDGVSLVSVPYWEWNALQIQHDKHQYLRSKLEIARNNKSF